MNGLTLSQFAAMVGEALRSTPGLWNAWVAAELSDVRVSGGHCYMELIEKNAAGQTVAKMRATVWASTLYGLRRKFWEATGRDISTGMKVLLRGSVSHHSLYGLAFNVTDIDPSYTLGDMERLRREILERLQREGVINNNKSQWMSPAPQRIAVVSAEGAAGYGDFMNQLLGNADGFVFYPCLFPAILQGDRTSASVREALRRIEETIDLWDCVVIIRGGGATTDLNGFDDYELARCVATFPLPVIVGIGHERDRTVLDEIAHTRMKTPTAVAGFLVDTLRSFSDRVSGMVDWIARYSTERIAGESRRLANCEAMIPALAKARLQSAQALLEREIARLPAVVETRLTRAHAAIDNIATLLRAYSGQRCERASGRLDELSRLLRISAEGVMAKERTRLETLESLATVLSPQNTLRRGYSITRVEGKAVTDASALKPGTRLETQLLDGTVESEVK